MSLCPTCPGKNLVVTFTGQWLDVVIREGRVAAYELIPSFDPRHAKPQVYCRDCMKTTDEPTTKMQRVLGRLAKAVAALVGLPTMLYEAPADMWPSSWDAAQAAALSADGMLNAQQERATA